MNYYKSNKRRFQIYSLANPLNGEIFYVGRTTMKLEKRLSCHYTSSKSGGCDFMKYLSDLKKKTKRRPVIELLDVAEFEKRKVVEEYWIQQLAAWGFPLVNIRHKKNRNYQVYTRRNSSLSESERELIKMLCRHGDHKIISRQLGLSEEMVRLYSKRKTIPTNIKIAFVAFYMDRAKAIHDWYLDQEKTRLLKVA